MKAFNVMKTIVVSDSKPSHHERFRCGSVFEPALSHHRLVSIYYLVLFKVNTTKYNSICMNTPKYMIWVLNGMQLEQTEKPKENLTTEQLKALVESKTYEKDGIKYIRLGNYALDFSVPYRYLGMTKSGNVKLGEEINDRVQNRIGFITPREQSKLIEGKWTVTGIEHNLHTDGYRYSTILERPEP